MFKYLKEYLGVVLKDRTRYYRALGNQRDEQGNPPWVHLKNRTERLLPNPHGPGVQCDFPFSSKLHALPFLSGFDGKLLKKVLTDWPMRFSPTRQEAGEPVVSFLFAHRGTDRIRQLIHVIHSILGQAGVANEIIVADLTQPNLGGEFPDGVTHLPIDDSHLTPGWRKAWAFNIAAHQARGKILVFQDGDICVPRDYSRELVRQLLEGDWQAASLQRFLFYLNEATTEKVLAGNDWPFGGIDDVTQNWKGGTIAIRRDCFFDIGGFDEGFVDWGGEDDEFYHRCSTLRHNRFGYLPFVHLWHPPQAVRKDQPNLNISHVMPWRMELNANERVSELRQRAFGQRTAPDPREAYKDRFLMKAHT
ncbi:MAG: galactosyltransferase-related protein [Planctomycetaceae bacterium]